MVHPRNTVVALTWFASMHLAQAQPVDAKADGQWRATLGAGFSHASGNSESTNLTLKADAARATDDDKWTLHGEALRARSDGVTSGNRLRFGGRYDWNLSPRSFVFGSADAERDTVAELDRRISVGTGVGYKLLTGDANTLSVFGGLGYTAERYAVARIVDDVLRDRYSHPTALFGEESTHAFSASTSAKQRLVVTADLQNSGEYRAQWDMGLDVAMSNALSLTVGLSVRHDSDPGFGLKSTDTLLTTGVALKFD